MISNAVKLILHHPQSENRDQLPLTSPAQSLAVPGNPLFVFSRMQNYGLIRQGTSVAVLKSIAIPKLRDDYILVQTVAVAVNPTDWTTLDAIGDNGTLVGCDYSGIVLEVGKAVTKNFQKGDRIAGFAHGGNTI